MNVALSHKSHGNAQQGVRGGEWMRTSAISRVGQRSVNLFIGIGRARSCVMRSRIRKRLADTHKPETQRALR